MTCSHDSYHDLFAAFNQRDPDHVRVRKAALADAVTCAGLKTAPPGIVDALSRRFAVCWRKPLFDFLTTHYGRNHP